MGQRIILDVGLLEDLFLKCNDYELFELFDGQLSNYEFVYILVESALYNFDRSGEILEDVIINISTRLDKDFACEHLSLAVDDILQSTEYELVMEEVNAICRFVPLSELRTKVSTSGAKMIIEVMNAHHNNSR